MANILFFVEDETYNRILNDKIINVELSHDLHLISLAEKNLKSHDIYFGKVSKYEHGCRYLHILGTKPVVSYEIEINQRDFFDGVITAYPAKHNREFFKKSKLIGYYPALYFVEMPDHFNHGEFGYYMRSLQLHQDYVLLQNVRQLDYLRILSRSYAGKDLSNISSVYSYLPTPKIFDINEYNRLRVKFGICSDEIVIFHGGGAWKWTDFYNFLVAYILYSRESNHKLKLIIPGLRQDDNHDHIEYCAKVNKLLIENSDLEFSENKNDWKILYEPDWCNASKNINDYISLSDVGLCVSPDSLESYLSQRVRKVDYIMNGLGVFTTPYDIISSQINGCDSVFVTKGCEINNYIETLKLLSTSMRYRNDHINHRAELIDRIAEYTEKNALDKALSCQPDIVHDCSANYAYHRGKVEFVKSKVEAFFKNDA